MNEMTDIFLFFHRFFLISVFVLVLLNNNTVFINVYDLEIEYYIIYAFNILIDICKITFFIF